MTFSHWSRLGQLLAVALLAIIGGLSFAVTLGGRATVLPVVVGAMAAVFVSSLLHERWRASLGVATLVSLLGLLVTVLALCRFNPALAIDGLVNGWLRLLTANVPAPAQADLVVVPLIVTWIAAFAAAELTQRTTSALAPVGPPVVAYTIGLMFGVDGVAARQGVLAVVALLAVAGALVMLRASYTVKGASSGVPVNTSNRRVAVGVGIIAVFAVVGTLLGVVLPISSARSPFELRDLVAEPPELRTALNPSAFVQKALNDREQPDAAPVFTVETTQDAEKARYRLVVLDDYDGKVWSSSGQFLRAANELPPAPMVTVPTATVRQKITIERLGGYWLPAVDWPTKVRDDDLVFDRSSGMLASRTGLTPGRTIEVESHEPQLAGNVDLPRTARFATGPAAQPYLRLPEQFTATLRAAATDGAAAAFQFQSAVELEKYVSTERGLQVAPKDRPRSGQSLADLDNLLTAAGGGIGSPDQFAALYAVLGRAVGMPTRLVVGYGVPPGAGRHEVKTNDLQVWPEVLFDGIGWVAFDPVPGGQAKPEQKPPEDKPNLHNTLENAAQPPTNPGDVGQPSSAAGAATSGNGAVALLRTVALLLLGLAIVLVVWIVVLRAVRSRRRRSRHRQPDPRQRIVGAWDEALDRLAECGLQDSRAMTATDVVRESIERLGPEASQPLASLRTIVNQARYRSVDPGPQHVDEAWGLATQFDQRWKQTLTFGDRLRLLVDPRPLFARR